MTLFGRKLGRESGDIPRDIRTIFDYIAYLVERLEYSTNQMEKRLASMDQQMTDVKEAVDAMTQEPEV